LCHLTQQQYNLLTTGHFTVSPIPLAQPTLSMNNTHTSEKPNSAVNTEVTLQSPAVATFTTNPTAIVEIAPQSETVENQDTMLQALLTIVSEKTGYPLEMLEPGMELKADLNIDSIQQIGIVAALQKRFPDLPRVQLAKLSHLRTLEQIAVYFQEQRSELKKKPFDSFVSPQSELTSNIPCRIARLKPLPAPDYLIISPTTHPLCLIVDDGTPTTSALAVSLIERKWQVVVLSLSQADADKNLSLPQGVQRVVLAPEEQVPEQLHTLTEKYGSIGAFIYLHSAQWQNTEYAKLAEKAVLKQFFLLLQHLKQPLQQAAQQELATLLMVTRFDGYFGLGQNNDFSPVPGGVFDILRTLAQEWKSVFCRAIDLAPSLDTKQSVQCILAEFHDPDDLLVEVGYSSEGRTTLVVELAPPIKQLA